MPDGLDISDLDNLFLTSVDDPEAEWLVAYVQTNGTAELFDIEEVGLAVARHGSKSMRQSRGVA